ncbi:YnhF family membrane protein [Providencia sneebia]
MDTDFKFGLLATIGSLAVIVIFVSQIF